MTAERDCREQQYNDEYEIGSKEASRIEVLKFEFSRRSRELGFREADWKYLYENADEILARARSASQKNPETSKE